MEAVQRSWLPQLHFERNPFLAKNGLRSKCNCGNQERCTASILFTAKDMDLKHVVYMVVSPYDVQRTNGTLILILKQFFCRK